MRSQCSNTKNGWLKSVWNILFSFACIIVRTAYFAAMYLVLMSTWRTTHRDLDVFLVRGIFIFCLILAPIPSRWVARFPYFAYFAVIVSSVPWIIGLKNVIWVLIVYPDDGPSFYGAFIFACALFMSLPLCIMLAVRSRNRKIKAPKLKPAPENDEVRA